MVFSKNFYVYPPISKENSPMSIDLIYSLPTLRQGWGQVQLTKYSSTSSIRNIYQAQVLVKYSFFKKKYLCTSSTFISSTSTSTSTYIKIGDIVL